jgi:hypothetical protein
MRVIAIQLRRTRPPGDENGRDEEKGRQVEDKTMAIQEDQDEDVTFFLLINCAHNGLPLGPSSLLRHNIPITHRL